MKNKLILILFLIGILFTGCRGIQPVLIMTPMDFVIFPAIYLILCYVSAMFLNGIDRSTKNNFWTWFIVCIVFTPILTIVAYSLLRKK